MAGKLKPQQSNSFTQKTFVNVPLTAEHKASIKDWHIDLSGLDDMLLKLLETDIRVTMSYDSYNQCYSATLAHTDDKHPDFLYLLSGKGSTPLKSVKQVLYIHEILLEHNWAAFSLSRQREEIDD